LRGDREVMFEVVMTVVNYPGAEVNWCEWWIENMQRPAWHRHRASRRSDTRSTIARISAASSNPRSWPSENRSEQETSSIQRSSNDHSPGCTGPIQEARVGLQRLAVINAGSIQTIAEREAGKNGCAGTYGKLPNQRTIHA
jgi:hypothetical protein